MSNDEQELQDLKLKSKLNPSEKARIKALETSIKKANKHQSTPKHSERNVFATTPTTKIRPLPIRFSDAERTGLTELANDIKTQSQQQVIEELGSEREINDTKLLRAAVYLLKEHSHAEIIDAIKQVKLNMIR